MKTEVTTQFNKKRKVTEIADQAIQSKSETLALAITENEQFKKDEPRTIDDILQLNN